MTYFVYFNDGYYDDGDVGLLEFETTADAEKWISDRLNRGVIPKTTMFTVIRGSKLEMEVVQVATKVRIKG